MSTALAEYVSGAPDRPCGYQQRNDLTVARDLDTAAPAAGEVLSALEGRPNRLLMQCTGQDVRWTDDLEVAPTATVGMLMKADTLYEYSGDISRLRFIQVAATAILNVSFYNS